MRHLGIAVLILAAPGASAQTLPLYQMHDAGAIWRFTGTPCSGNTCPGWQAHTRTIVVAAKD